MEVLIRADASIESGTGHIMRTLALGQECMAAGIKPTFCLARTTAALNARLVSEQLEVLAINATPGGDDDAAETIKLARHLGAAWVVADGYHFGAAWQNRIKAAGEVSLLVFDDYGHASHYFADVVLNQNLGACAELYAHKEDFTRVLLGTRYVQLRREFSRWREWTRDVHGVARRILVTMGGSDPHNVTGAVLSALAALPALEVEVVIGGSNPHLNALQSQAAELSASVNLNVDERDMGKLMAAADIAISAAGTTSWELAFMSLPNVIITLAENQVDIAAALAAERVSVNLGMYSDVSAERIRDAVGTLLNNESARQRMGRRGRELVDGRGGERAVRHLEANSLRGGE